MGDFRQQIEALIAYLGLDDAEGVTPENVADWCDYLKQEEKIGKQEEKIGARTVSQKYLAAAKAAFGLAVEKRRLKTNPAADVSARFTKPKRTRPSGFTDDEARAILTAALAGPETLGRRTDENKRANRWGPWFCAFKGARISEIMQLRTDDLSFEQVEGQTVPHLRITPEAGSAKTGKLPNCACPSATTRDGSGRDVQVASGRSDTSKHGVQEKVCRRISPGPKRWDESGGLNTR